MSTKSMRILNVAAGVLLIAAGIYCLCNQDVALLSAGLLLGIFLLLSGVAEIVVFAAASGVMLGSGWLLLDGILTVIMSLFLLFNQWFTMLSLPFLFTLWLLFSGVSQCVSSFDLRALGVRAWGWILAVGILLTLAGFICLMDPWVSVAAMGMTVGHRISAGGCQFHCLRLHFQNKGHLIGRHCCGAADTDAAVLHINWNPIFHLEWRNCYGTQHLW